ncbi:MAG: hypothetical protein BWK73_09245 [Thiothrix lacustris]|uniref:Uncharacterized protein n=1 Tax=Thiothrix lacustris TaxID=525917 RepID=A0A1Y1QV20_9GAMM|nr:MAG: hypothetical protein BWK73_09245 [Thiothrix lacustris]
MVGDKYYGANASTFIGALVVGVSLVSLLSALATEVPVIEVGNSRAWSVLASIAGVAIGGALIASKEWVGGVMAIIMVVTLAKSGVGVNHKQFLRVVEGAIDGVSAVANAIETESANAGGYVDTSGVGQNALFEGYTKGAPLSPLAKQQCSEGMAWTKKMSGVRACTTGYEWKKEEI